MEFDSNQYIDLFYQDAGEHLDVMNTETLDRIRSIFEQGAAQAGQSMGTMIGRKLEININQIEEVPFQDLYEGLYPPDTPMAVIVIRISGANNGYIVFLMYEENAGKLNEILWGEMPFEDGVINLSPSAEPGSDQCGRYGETALPEMLRQMQRQVNELQSNLGKSVRRCAYVVPAQLRDDQRTKCRCCQGVPAQARHPHRSRRRGRSERTQDSIPYQERQSTSARSGSA